MLLSRNHPGKKAFLDFGRLRMIIDRTHRPWIYVVFAAGIGAGLCCLFATSALTPGSSTCLWFGIAAATLVVWELCLAIRKRFTRSPIFTMATWLKSHIWL